MIPCHRFVICSRSQFFATEILKDKADETRNSVYEIQDMTYDVAINLLQFIYTNNCTLLQRKITYYDKEDTSDLDINSNFKLPLANIGNYIIKK